MESDFLSELGLNAIVTRLKRVSDTMLHDGKRMYKQLGMDIEPNWFAVFKLLKRRGPMSITEIAEAIRMSHPSLISIVNKMVAAKYLLETRSEKDSRRRLLQRKGYLQERSRQCENRKPKAGSRSETEAGY